MARRKRGGFVYRQAQIRGLLGGSRPWTMLWVVLVARRVLRRLTRDEPEILYSEELRDGEAVVLSAKRREPRVIGR